MAQCIIPRTRSISTKLVYLELKSILMSNLINRNSSIELLRIISMWMIVFYHFHTHVLQYGSDAVVFKAVQIPLHIAVICFVLISGYFGINASIKGFSKLFGKIMFYALAIIIIVVLYDTYSGSQLHYSSDYVNQHPLSKGVVLNCLLFVSRTPLWFIRSYLFLYIISPFLNEVLANQSKQERIQLLIVLGFITIWSDFFRADGMGEGKSVLNFAFIYIIGRTINEYQLLYKISLKVNLISYFTVTILTLVLFVFFDGTYIDTIIWLLSFKYNGLFCVLSAILFFILFARFTFQSDLINTISASILAVYLIHENPLLNYYIYSIVNAWQYSLSVPMLYIFLVLYSLVIMIIAVLIDKITLPLQKRLSGVISFALTSLGGEIGLIKK